MTYHIYIIYSETLDKHYVGYSQHPLNRLDQHNSNSKDKYTGRSRDWELKAVFEVGSESCIAELFVLEASILVYDQLSICVANRNEKLTLRELFMRSYLNPLFEEPR